MAGGSATYTVAVAGVNGFSGTVSFAVSGLPAGVTGSFSPKTVTGAGSSTLTISTTASAPNGKITITATGTSGSLNHSAAASLTITSGATLTVVSVSPNSGTGLQRKFAFKFEDSHGEADISSIQIDINATLTSAASCYIDYNRASNAIYLADNAGNWQGPLTIGSHGTLSNSQCSLNAGTSSMSASGNTLTLNLVVTFEPAFAGAKNIYMAVLNPTLNSGWSKKGAWTVP